MVELQPIVQTAGLTKVFKDFWRRDRVVAVRDLNMEIFPGEVFGLLGPNGSGKSTTIKMLLGLLYPSRGRIAMFGRAPTDVKVKSRIGFLPEESYLYRFLDARETLDYYARLFRLPAKVREERIDRLLEMVGLAHEAKRRVGEYSKGMARRIGLAQALINDPELLILDEPTSGMDPVGTRQIKDVIRDLAARGKTVLLSSHLLADVEDVCDRIAILYGGQQRTAGPTRELLRQQEFTQIKTERLPEKTLEEVKALIERDGGRKIVEVSAPTERLETFFLRVVQEAQAANVVTHGVRAAGELPDFLTGPAEGEQVVDSLVDAAKQRERPEPVEPAPVQQERREEPAREMLESLTAPASDKPKPTEPAEKEHTKPEPPARPEPPPQEADRQVLDGLLRKPTSSDDDGIDR